MYEEITITLRPYPSDHPFRLVGLAIDLKFGILSHYTADEIRAALKIIEETEPVSVDPGATHSPD